MTNTQKNAINLIRSIMRLGGKTQVWNNLYDTGTRTVKCYRDQDFQKDIKLVSIIEKTLNALDIRHVFIFTEPSGGPFNPGTGGFIVRLPAVRVTIKSN